MDLECVRLEYRLCRLLGDPALVCHGNADRILWDCQHVGIYFPDHQYAIKNYFYRNFGNLVLLTNSELKILAKMQNILFWSTLVVAVGADIIFIFSGHWQYANIQPIFRYGAGGFTAGIALLIMKFVGFDLIPQLSEEANFPKKDLWKAFVGSIGCTVLIYGYYCCRRCCGQ